MDMDRRTFIGGIAATGFTLTAIGTVAAGGGTRYVVSGNRHVAARVEAAGATVHRELADGRVLLVGTDDEAALRDVPGVDAVTPDVRFALESPAHEVSIDQAVEEPLFHDALLWDKQLTRSLDANELATGEGAAIAILDTGIDYAHPELTPNLAADAGLLFREGEVRAGVGEVVVPDDYANPTALTTAEFHVADDQEGHGTHVAGIAAAADGGGVIGTAPDASLVSHRVFWWDLIEEEDDEGDLEEVPALLTTTGDVLTAIEFASLAGYDAANLSLSTGVLPPQTNREALVRAYRQVVRAATRRGTVVVTSAGNHDADIQRGGVFVLPNSAPGAVSVGATGPNDERSFYSNRGTSEIDVAAPGGGYETLVKTLCGIVEWIEAGQPVPPLEEDPREEGDESQVCFDEDGNVVLDPADAVECVPCHIPAWAYPFNLVFSTTSARIEGGAYGWKAGTSMSAPQVAGLVALVRDLDPDAKSRHVASAIQRGAEGGTGRSDPGLGAGRIDALNTLELL